MTRRSIRASLTPATALAVGLAMVSTLLPSTGALAASRVQVALNRAAETQPRFIPKAPDAVDEFTATPELKPIHFAFDRASVRRVDAAIVDANAAWLRANPTYAILVAGYADERGTTGYNLALGARRAISLRDQLVARGVRADRITVVSYGENLPSCRTAVEPCWAANRAAVVLVRRNSPQTP
jgi:peptidoglycan-associated lipoprotein